MPLFIFEFGTKISDEEVAMEAVPTVELLEVWPEMEELLVLSEAITKPPVVSWPKLAEPEASTEPMTLPPSLNKAKILPESLASCPLPTAKVPEIVAVLVSKLLAKIFPVTKRSPSIATWPLG